MAHAADRVYNVEVTPELPRALRALANEAGVTEDGPHPAAEVVPSPSGPSIFSLPDRALDVPYTSVYSGHPWTTTVHAYALPTVGSARTERAERASQARGE